VRYGYFCFHLRGKQNCFLEHYPENITEMSH